MFYLRKEPSERTIPEMTRPNGEIIPERKYMEDDRAIFKSNDSSRYYRGIFVNLDTKYQGMKVYQCKKLRTILSLREDMFNYCGEWFDVWDENGKVNISDVEGAKS